MPADKGSNRCAWGVIWTPVAGLRRRLHMQQLTRQWKACLAAAVGQKTIVPVLGVNYPELSATTIVSGAVGR